MKNIVKILKLLSGVLLFVGCFQAGFINIESTKSSLNDIIIKDARLREITATDASGDVNYQLTPAFHPEVTDYTLDIKSKDPNLKIIFKKLHTGTIEDGNGDTLIKKIDLNVTEQVINVKVISSTGEKNLTYKITIKWNYCKVSFNSTGGSSVPVKIVEYRELLEKPSNPTKLNLHFDNWYSDQDYKTLWNFSNTKVTTPITLYAKWIAYVSFETNGGSTIEPLSVAESQLITAKPEDPKKEGFAFIGWYKDAGLTDAWYFNTPVTSDITLYAKWFSGVKVKLLSVVETGGASKTKDSTGLILTFDINPTTLSADNITVTGATKGALTGSGTTRTIAISDITVTNGNSVTVAMSNLTGYLIEGAPMNTYVYRNTNINFDSVVQTGGIVGTADSTGLLLTFSGDPTTLSASNITVTGATKGALTGSGTTRTLAISAITVSNGSSVEVAITSPAGYTIGSSPKTAVVYKVLTPVTFLNVVQTGGTSGMASSTGLLLTFDVDPTKLSADNITVTGAAKGALTGSGTTRTLAISNITVANGETVSVSITNPTGYNIGGSPKTAVVYRNTGIPVTFQSVVQTGGTSGTTVSTGLLLTFDVDPTILSTDNITVTGATKGALTGSGTTRTLAISALTVAIVTVAITSPVGYNISGSPKTAVVFRGTLTIGEPYQGGIIAYILQSGDPGYVTGETHGLIASIADLSTGIQWYNGSNTTTGATGTALGTGQANTIAIVNNQGAGSYAAKLCNDYTNTDTGTGVYSDWFLPSRDELIKIYNEKLLVGFSFYYWSSSESDSNSARQQHFYEGGDNRDKASYFKVRAVRYF